MNAPQKRIVEFDGQSYVLILDEDYNRLCQLLTECKAQLTTAYERISAEGEDRLADKLASAVYDIEGWQGRYP